MDNLIPNLRPVDDKKVTDRHALLITGNMPKELSKDDQTVYEMVAGRMLESFSKKCIKDMTTVVLSCADTSFEAKGSIQKQAGWRAVLAKQRSTAVKKMKQSGIGTPATRAAIIETLFSRDYIRREKNHFSQQKRDCLFMKLLRINVLLTLL